MYDEERVDSVEILSILGNVLRELLSSIDPNRYDMLLKDMDDPIEIITLLQEDNDDSLNDPNFKWNFSEIGYGCLILKPFRLENGSKVGNNCNISTFCVIKKGTEIGD